MTAAFAFLRHALLSLGSGASAVALVLVCAFSGTLLAHDANAEYPEESMWLGEFLCNDKTKGEKVISFAEKKVTLVGKRACREWREVRDSVIRLETEKLCLNEDGECDGRWDVWGCENAQENLRRITRMAKKRGASEIEIKRKIIDCSLWLDNSLEWCIANIRKKVQSCASDVERLIPPVLAAALSVRADYDARREAERKRALEQEKAEAKRREAQHKEWEKAKAAKQEILRKEQIARHESERKERIARDEYEKVLNATDSDAELFAAYEKCVADLHPFCDNPYFWAMDQRRHLWPCLKADDKMACVQENNVRKVQCEELRQSAYDPRWHERLLYWWDTTAWFRAKDLYEQECDG